MRLSQSASREEVYQALVDEVTTVWGYEELGSLMPTIENTSDALWLLSKEPLDMMGEEPDFLDNAVSRAE
jgi:hypothetical protein